MDSSYILSLSTRCIVIWETLENPSLLHNNDVLMSPVEKFTLRSAGTVFSLMLIFVWIQTPKEILQSWCEAGSLPEALPMPVTLMQPRCLSISQGVSKLCPFPLNFLGSWKFQGTQDCWFALKSLLSLCLSLSLNAVLLLSLSSLSLSLCLCLFFTFLLSQHLCSFRPLFRASTGRPWIKGGYFCSCCENVYNILKTRPVV